MKLQIEPPNPLTLRLLAAVLVLVVSNVALAGPDTNAVDPSSPDVKKGSVCFLMYGSFILDPKDEHAVLEIDGTHQAPLRGQAPRLLADDLDLNKRHRITLKEAAGTTRESWSFRFKRNTTMMNFWRSPGYWHLEPSTSNKCEVPLEKKP